MTDLKHALSLNPLGPAYRNGETRRCQRDDGAAAAAREWIAFAGGLSTIGDASDGFAFDNERPRHRVLVPPFRLATRLVTAAEYWPRSSTMAATSAPSSGSPTAGRPCSAKAGARRSTGAVTDDGVVRVHARRAGAASPATSRSVTSASTRPTRSRAGPARACRAKRSGSTPPAGARRARAPVRTTVASSRAECSILRPRRAAPD